MKKYFLAGLALVFLLAVGLISYGAYLNYHDENQITERLTSRFFRWPVKSQGTRYKASLGDCTFQGHTYIVAGLGYYGSDAINNRVTVNDGSY